VRETGLRIKTKGGAQSTERAPPTAATIPRCGELCKSEGVGGKERTEVAADVKLRASSQLLATAPTCSGDWQRGGIVAAATMGRSTGAQRPTTPKEEGEGNLAQLFAKTGLDWTEELEERLWAWERVNMGKRELWCVRKQTELALQAARARRRPQQRHMAQLELKLVANAALISVAEGRSTSLETCALQQCVDQTQQAHEAYSMTTDLATLDDIVAVQEQRALDADTAVVAANEVVRGLYARYLAAARATKGAGARPFLKAFVAGDVASDRLRVFQFAALVADASYAAALGARDDRRNVNCNSVVAENSTDTDSHARFGTFGDNDDDDGGGEQRAGTTTLPPVVSRPRQARAATHASGARPKGAAMRVQDGEVLLRGGDSVGAFSSDGKPIGDDGWDATRGAPKGDQELRRRRIDSVLGTAPSLPSNTGKPRAAPLKRATATDGRSATMGRTPKPGVSTPPPSPAAPAVRGPTPTVLRCMFRRRSCAGPSRSPG
jgi:hypothetical protein